MNDGSELQALYRRTVIDHSRHPRNFRRVADADSVAEGHNPLCGDKVTIYLKLGDDSIEEIAFEGVGCAIALASASIMTEQIGRESTDEARHEIERVMRQFDRTESGTEALSGDMAALSGVRAYPSRIKCATLAWKTLLAALDGENRPVSTEE
ncbi:MAG: Fe-S cluster assembly sulfur transfer protein SufU [Gammaproteobacteria bacterium]